MSNNTSLTEIDKAIQAAKDRKAKKEQSVSPEDKVQKKLEREAARAAEKLKRDEERASKKASKEAKKPQEKTKNPRAHLAKLDKASSMLPKLEGDRLVEAFANLQSMFDTTELSLLAIHIQHLVRSLATVAATRTKIEAGTKVKIVGGDPKYVGQEGIVNKAQRIRCYVELASGKVVYCFTSDVSPVESTVITGDTEFATIDDELESTGTDN